ncbi:MAG: hypothetical protein JOZ78_00975 [Chroococcidiopsidaceae cyanobacterium CP_BM_ER_R8_30]|nr:hypothetical protein [Chroococcidiopsidaceae cyanobacterium CP_BM_ER_R8_30]
MESFNSHEVLVKEQRYITLLVPIGSLLKAKTGSWVTIFELAITFNITAAILALFVLKPLHVQWFSKAQAAAGYSSPEKLGL